MVERKASPIFQIFFAKKGLFFVFFMLQFLKSVLQCTGISKKEVQGNMAYTISDACIECGACVSECPVDAIAEGDGKYVIDAEKCIDCGSCADACPVDAPAE